MRDMVVAWIRLVQQGKGYVQDVEFIGLDDFGRSEDESPADSWLSVHCGDIFRETLEREQAWQEGRVPGRYM